MSDDLRFLGKQTNEPSTLLDVIDKPPNVKRVVLSAMEFTSICPVTKQPDSGKLTIDYVPDRFIVETKSLKLFLWTYRSRESFNEAIVDEIAQELFRQIKPLRLSVVGDFALRGGISVRAEAALVVE